MKTQPTLLIVDDDVPALESLERLLIDEFDVRTATSAAEAEKILRKDWVQIVLCDQRMPGVTGVDFLATVKERWPEVIRMIISACTESDEILASVNDAGIYQYITKPWDSQQLLMTLRNAAELFALNRQNELLSVELKLAPRRLEEAVAQQRGALRRAFADDDGIVRSADSPMNAVCSKLHQVAPYDISVLLTGESGTGKELAARALHYNSLRWEKPFVVENCGALPDELLESELFGYKQGAFTGAIEDRTGLFERADGGTVFLDEIGEVSPAFQVKLLRVLQDGEIRPLGSGRTRRVDVRVIAATNRDLEADVAAGRFREDLYYRLAAVTVDMPPLRERIGDLPSIADALLTRAIQGLGKSVDGFTEEAIACMQQHTWPGNVRELQNEIQRMLVECRGSTLGADLLSPRVLCASPNGDGVAVEAVTRLDGTLKSRIEMIEASILKESLIRHRWNKSRAARELGLSRVGLRSKLERYGLEQVGADEVPAQGIAARAAS